MKISFWDGSYGARKGVGRSRSTSYFVVSNKKGDIEIAFPTKNECSLDGHTHSSGFSPSRLDQYFFQDEIVLEERDNTTFHCGNVSYDETKVITKSPSWRFSWESRSGRNSATQKSRGLIKILEGPSEHLISQGLTVTPLRSHENLFISWIYLSLEEEEKTKNASSFEEALKIVNASRQEREALQSRLAEMQSDPDLEWSEELVRAVIAAHEPTDFEVSEGSRVNQVLDLIPCIEDIKNGKCVVVFYTADNESLYVLSPNRLKVPSAGHRNYINDRVGRESLQVIYPKNTVPIRGSKEIYLGSLGFLGKNLTDLMYNSLLGYYTVSVNKPSDGCHGLAYQRFYAIDGKRESLPEYYEYLEKTAQERQERYYALAEAIVQVAGQNFLDSVKKISPKGHLLADLEAIMFLHKEHDMFNVFQQEDILLLLEESKNAEIFKIAAFLEIKKRSLQHVKKVAEKAYAWAYVQDAGLRIPSKLGFPDYIEALKDATVLLETLSES